MDIDRRRLRTTAACMALAGTIGDFRASDYQTPGSASPWHPLTCSLLERAQRFSSAAGRVNRAQVERIIHELASAQGRAVRPVIKWLEDPAEAFDHLSRYGLDALLRMGTASLGGTRNLWQFDRHQA
jgi:hypothetical protein